MNFVPTPGTVTINRAYDDLLVKCELADKGLFLEIDPLCLVLLF